MVNVRRGTKSPQFRQRRITWLKIFIQNFVLTNRLISEKRVFWDLIPPFDFVANFLASRASRRGEQTSLSASQNLQNPVWWTIIENTRTFFKRNTCDVSQNPKPLGRGGKERSWRGRKFPPRLRFRASRAGGLKNGWNRPFFVWFLTMNEISPQTIDKPIIICYTKLAIENEVKFIFDCSNNSLIRRNLTLATE